MAIIEHFEGDGFSFSHSCDMEPQDNYFPLHIHDNHELFCLVKGDVGYIVEGRRYKLYPGTLLMMRSSESHKLIVNSSAEYERYVINFTSDFLLKNGFDNTLLSPLLQRELGQKNRYSPKDFQNLTPISFFEKLENEAKVISHKSAVLSNLSSLLSAINVAFLKKSNKDTDEGGIIAFVNENLTKDLSVEEIASFVHLSPSQLSRVFKRLSGTSVYEYILSKRLILFHEKLKTGIGVQEASVECGFRDYSAFYRLYKKRFGVSPKNTVKTPLSQND